MLAAIGLLTIVIMLAAIITKRMTPLAALIMFPIVASLVSGFGLDTGKFIVSGIQSISPMVAMFIFAILFFGVVTDAGMFDPIISRILRFVGGDPTRIVMGSALLAMIVHLDGSGAVTFLITIPAMLPLYERLNMDRKVLACVVALGAGTMNMLPWGGPTLRAATSLHIPVTELFNPALPALAAGLLFVFGVSYYLGKRESARLGITSGSVEVFERQLTEEEQKLRRPQNFWINIVLTAAVICGLVWGKIAPAVLFMVGSTLVLIINYPKVADQRARVDAHAKAALMMASVLLAAGVFTGIMKGAGLTKAMTQVAVSFIPVEMAHHIPFIVAVMSMPLSLLFDPDSFYFGVLPVVAEIAKTLGVPAIQVGQAAIMGQMTTGFPISPLTPATFLLIGLTKLELGDHQKFTIPLAFATTLVMTLVSIVIGLFPL
ncbi:MAG: citrate transporter [Anaerosporomusa subterranea]|nr:citrate transporter [Anaerosporomusa subterranea]